MTEIEPPIDQEVDLTDFTFMPLDVRRVRDSKFAASGNGEAFRSAVLLWCAAWHQLPAGSLPDDDIELAQLAGFGRSLAQWKKVRAAGALYGWRKCSDGRLYHSVVVEKAKEAWQSKLDQKYRRECDRLRKENKRRSENQEPALKYPSFDEWNSERRASGIPTERSHFPADANRNSSGRPPDSVLKGQGRDREGTGKREGNSPALPDVPSETVNGSGSGEHPTAARPRAASTPAGRGTRIPEGFTPDTAYALAELPDLDVEREAAKFCDYWRGRSGAGGIKLDWPATWRNWIRRCKDSGTYPRKAPTPNTPVDLTKVKWQ